MKRRILCLLFAGLTRLCLAAGCAAKEPTRQKFTVRIWETVKQSMLRYQRVLGNLEFVQNCTPDIDVLGADGRT